MKTETIERRTMGAWLALLGVLVAAVGALASGDQRDRMSTLTLVAPPGPMAIPMARLVVDGRLDGIADKIEFFLWENPDQLRAIVAGSQADFLTLPSNSAATFYNRGFGVQLLDISVWNILYVVSVDASISSFSDLEGQQVIVPFRGSMPDLLYQFVARSHDVDPFEDIALQYAPNPQQAAQLLLSGRATTAVLSEPLVTMVLLQTAGSDRPLHRVINFGDALAGIGESGVRSAIAGTVALPSVHERPEVVEAFVTEYEKAVAWMLAHPEEAGRMAEDHLPELGFQAGPVAESLQHIEWRFTPATRARGEVEAFFAELMTLSPEVIGGRLPDEGFYWTEGR